MKDSKASSMDCIVAACVIPIYKGKVERMECANYRGISILSIPGKIYTKVLINIVIERTKDQVP